LENAGIFAVALVVGVLVLGVDVVLIKIK